MARTTRRSLLFIAGLALLPVAALALALALSHGWQRDRLRSALEDALSDALPGTQLSIAAVEGVLHRDFVLRDLVLRRKGATPLELKRVRIRVASLSVLPRPHIALAAIEIDGARLPLLRDPDGSWKLEALAPGQAGDAETAGPNRFPVPTLELAGILVRDSFVELRWQQADQLHALEARFELETGPLLLPEAPLPEHAHLTLQVEPDADRPFALETASLELRLRPREATWSLEPSRLRGPGIEVEAEGSGSQQGIDALSLRARIDDLSGLAALLPQAEGLSGSLTADVRLSGPYDAPLGNVQLHGKDLELSGFPLGRLEARLRASGDGSVVIENLEIAGGDLAASVAAGSRISLGRSRLAFEELRMQLGGGSLRMDGAVTSDRFELLRITTDRLDLATLAPVLRRAGAPWNSAGRLSAELRLQGALRAPIGTLRLDWRDARLSDFAADRIVLELDSAASGLNATASAQRSGQGQLEAELQLPAQAWSRTAAELLASAQTRVRLRAQALQSAWLAPLLPGYLATLRGSLDGNLAFQGGERFPEELALELSSAELALEDDSLRDLQLALAGRGPGELELLRLALTTQGRSIAALPGGHVRYRENLLEFTGLQLSSDGDTLAIDGGIGPEAFRSLVVSGRGLDLGAIAARTDPELGLAGRLDLELRLDGAFTKPSVDGRLELHRPAVASTPESRIALELESDAELIHARGRMHVARKPVASVEASLPRELHQLLEAPFASSRSSLELRSDALDLSHFEALLPSFLRDLEGVVNARLHARGGTPVPELDGSLDLKGGALFLPLVGRSFAPITARVRLERDALLLDELAVGPPSASSTLSGRVELDSLRPRSADLRLVLERFPLTLSRLVQGELSGELSARGSLPGLEVRGSLETHQLRIQLPDPSDPLAKEIRIRSNGPASPEAVDIREAEASAPSFLDPTDLDLRLQIPEDSWIRGSGANLEVAGKLRVRKAGGEAPSYQGTLRVVRGSYRLHGRNFALEKGSARLNGGSELDPLLDVLASHRVRDVTILAEISGRASAPRVRLRSEPSLPETDVISYLLLGRPAAEAGAIGQSALEAAATQVAVGAALDQMQALLGNAIPVDTLDYRMGEAGQPGVIEVGRRIGDRIFVRYGRSLGSEPEDEVRTELRLTPNWSIESEVTRSGNAGADLIWSLDF